jgi:ribosome-binding factor A
MATVRRADRVAREIQAELSRLAQRELKDPRVQQVTFTRVELSADLREAKVFFVPLGAIGESDRIGELQQGLRGASSFLQRKLGRNLRLRFTPRLQFRYDVGVDNLVGIHDLMSGLVGEVPAGTAKAGSATNEPGSEDSDGTS